MSIDFSKRMSGGLLRRNVAVRHGRSLAGTRVPQNANEGAIHYLRHEHHQFLPFGNDGTEIRPPAQ
jgi:hypothetical protein